MSESVESKRCIKVLYKYSSFPFPFCFKTNLNKSIHITKLVYHRQIVTSAACVKEIHITKFELKLPCCTAWNDTSPGHVEVIDQLMTHH